MSVTKLGWVDSLPQELKTNIVALIQKESMAINVLDDLYKYLNDDFENKRRKTSPVTVNDDQTIKMLSDYSIQINRKILEEETIFELPQISFQSPLRKKMNLVLHLIPENGANPILSIVNSSTGDPEMSYIQLDKAVKLCILLPILGMSTVESKRNIGSLCLWLNDEAIPDPSKGDPIICQINLDLIKKHLVKTGKIPATAESQMLDPTQPDGIKPINEAIIQFLTRQFQLCGINLVNYLPSCDINRNSLRINNDTGIVISHRANTINDMLTIEAYKGSKDGTLIFTNKNEFNPSYFGFGFKKPIMLYSFDKVVSYSYSEITKYTFTIRFEINNTKKEKEEVVEFSMIDQQYFAAIDDFLKMQDIDNNSFAENMKEKSTKTGTGDTSEATAATQPQDQSMGPQIAEDDDDDEEDDGNYQGGEEEEDVAEEYDSNAEGSDQEDEGNSDGEETQDNTLQQGVEEDIELID